jgi:hypothetical protein
MRLKGGSGRVIKFVPSSRGAYSLGGFTHTFKKTLKSIVMEGLKINEEEPE